MGGRGGGGRTSKFVLCKSSIKFLTHEVSKENEHISGAFFGDWGGNPESRGHRNKIQ